MLARSIYGAVLHRTLIRQCFQMPPPSGWRFQQLMFTVWCMVLHWDSGRAQLRSIHLHYLSSSSWCGCGHFITREFISTRKMPPGNNQWSEPILCHSVLIMARTPLRLIKSVFCCQNLVSSKKASSLRFVSMSSYGLYLTGTKSRNSPASEVLRYSFYWRQVLHSC